MAMTVPTIEEARTPEALVGDGARLGYCATGGTGVAVITPLSYGTTLDGLAQATTQNGFLRAIAGGHQLITYDQRGIGRSRAAGAPESWQQRGEDLWSVADAAGIERAVLYGVFDGGYTIAHAAAQQPDRVLGLIFNLVPPVFVATPDFAHGIPAAVVDDWYGNRGQANPDGLLRAMRALGFGGADVDLLVSAWQEESSAEVLDRLRALLSQADLRPLALSLPMRALVIEPQRRPAIVGWGRAMAELLSAATLLRPASAGESLGAIQGFLARVEIEQGRQASKISPNFSAALGAMERSVASLRRIVVPVVDDVSSERAAEMACRLGATQQAEIVLVHVVEVPHTRSLDDASADQLARGGQALQLGQAIAARHGLQSQTHLLVGRSAAREILRIAAEQHADLIIMARGEKRSLIPTDAGQTMQEVLRRAPCEVLIDQAQGVSA